MDPVPDKTDHTPAVTYLIAVGVILVVAVLLQTVGKPLWQNFIDSDWVRAQGLEAGSGWPFDATLERMRRSPQPVAADQLDQLYELAITGSSRATDTLVSLMARQELPEPLVQQILRDMKASEDRRRTSIYLISLLARSRDFGSEVENALVAAMQPSLGGLNYAVVSALGNLGVQRPLSTITLQALVASAERNPRNLRSVLTVLIQTSAAHDLPDWVLSRITRLAVSTRDPGAQNDTLKLLAAVGSMDTAFTLLRSLDHSLVDRQLVATVIKTQPTADLQRMAKDAELRGVVRAGALTELLARDEDIGFTTELIDIALASADIDLRRTAFAGLTRLERKRPGALNIDWQSTLMDGLNDPDSRVQTAAQEAFRFSPLLDTERTALLQQLLTRGTNTQQYSVLRILFSSRSDPSPKLRQLVQSLVQNPDADIAAMARNLTSRWDPDASTGTKKRDTSSFLLLLFAALPILICGGFGIYFVARLVVYMRARSRRALTAFAISFTWALLSYGLALLLFMFAIAGAHGSRYGTDAIVMYLVVIAMYAGIGTLLRLPLRR